jgi:hypothetical protein
MLTAVQKSAEGVLGHVVGKASEALRRRKVETTDRLSRERWLKRNVSTILRQSHFVFRLERLAGGLAD